MSVNVPASGTACFCGMMWKRKESRCPELDRKSLAYKKEDGWEAQIVETAGGFLGVRDIQEEEEIFCTVLLKWSRKPSDWELFVISPTTDVWI